MWKRNPMPQYQELCKRSSHYVYLGGKVAPTTLSVGGWATVLHYHWAFRGALMRAAPQLQGRQRLRLAQVITWAKPSIFRKTGALVFNPNPYRLWRSSRLWWRWRGKRGRSLKGWRWKCPTDAFLIKTIFWTCQRPTDRKCVGHCQPRVSPW